MPCAVMDKAWLIIEDDKLGIGGEVEYVKGFGEHYSARPEVILSADSTLFISIWR